MTERETSPPPSPDPPDRRRWAKAPAAPRVKWCRFRAALEESEAWVEMEEDEDGD